MDFKKNNKKNPTRLLFLVQRNHRFCVSASGGFPLVLVPRSFSEDAELAFPHPQHRKAASFYRSFECSHRSAPRLTHR